MKVVGVGDLHGEVTSLFRLLDAEQPDGLLCVGDWGDPGQIPDSVWHDLLVRLPVLSVFGNHDDLPLLSSLRNRNGTPVLLAQGERRQGFCGLTVAGVSGIWAKSHRQPYYVTDEDVAAWAERLAEQPPPDVLLSHGCPIGIADRTPAGRPGGQRCFLELLRAVRPRFYLCGHIHVAQARVLEEPACAVFNTGALAQGHYVLFKQTTGGSDGEEWIAEARRLPEPP